MVLLQLSQADLQVKDVLLSDGVFELLEVQQSVAEDVDAVEQRVERWVNRSYPGRTPGRLPCGPTSALSPRSRSETARRSILRSCFS